MKFCSKISNNNSKMVKNRFRKNRNLIISKTIRKTHLFKPILFNWFWMKTISSIFRWTQKLSFFGISHVYPRYFYLLVILFFEFYNFLSEFRTVIISFLLYTCCRARSTFLRLLRSSSRIVKPRITIQTP